MVNAALQVSESVMPGAFDTHTSCTLPWSCPPRRAGDGVRPRCALLVAAAAAAAAAVQAGRAGVVVQTAQEAVEACWLGLPV
jgi:hypothetical protein